MDFDTIWQADYFKTWLSGCTWTQDTFYVGIWSRGTIAEYNTSNASATGWFNA